MPLLLSSTHNESAWRPARYLVFRSVFALLSTNTRGSLKIFGFVGRDGRSREQIGGVSAIARALCQRDQGVARHPSGSFLGHLVI